MENEKCFDTDMIYNIKPFPTFEELVEFITKLPEQTKRELLGMPQAISDYRKRKDTNKLLSDLMSTQNLSIQAKVLTETSQILARVESFIEIIPNCFNIDELNRKQQETFSNMQIILCQELSSCNKLIECVTGAMASLREALVGINIMNEDVEETFKHVKHNTVMDDFKVLKVISNLN